MNKMIGLCMAIGSLMSLIRAGDYVPALTLHNETGSEALTRLPSASEWQPFGLHDHLSLWQLDPDNSDAIAVKFSTWASYALQNKTFKISPGDSRKWGDLPNGRVELHLESDESLLATLQYQNTDGEWKEIELQVSGSGG